MTNILSFPGLGLEFSLNSVAFTIFGWSIYWYGVIIAIGFLAGVGYCYWRAPQFGLDREKLMDSLFFGVPLCIIGARAYYIIFNPSIYFHEDGTFNWKEAVSIWNGGLAIYGAIIMAILTAIVYCRVRKQSFWGYADILSYGLIIGQIIGRWGNFFNIEAYGTLTTLPWRMCSESIANDLMRKGLLESEAVYQSILNGTVGVHPTFLYESLWNLLGFILLIILARRGRKFNGQIFLSYICWYGVGRAFIEPLRTDSLYLFNTGIRTSQMVSIIAVVAAVIIFFVRWKTAGPPTPPSWETQQDKENNGSDPDEKNDTQEKINERNENNGSSSD